MTVKSSISLTDPQARFARTLVESGQYSSLSSVLQQGLELLRQKSEAEELELAALRQLVDRRMSGSMISAGEMDAQIEQMIARKQGVVDQTTKGIDFLMKKNNIEVLDGNGVIKTKNTKDISLAMYVILVIDNEKLH